VFSTFVRQALIKPYTINGILLFLEGYSLGYFFQKKKGYNIYGVVPKTKKPFQFGKASH
jgi:hypothetical protein